MPLNVNLRQLDDEYLQIKGDLPVEDLDIERLDELIHVPKTLQYELEVQRIDQSVLAQGTITLQLECECVRCLKPFSHELRLDEWACHVPLEGEDAAPISGDAVDLTPYLREDIVLAFPQHPLCDPECGGLAGSPKKEADSGVAAKPDPAASAWSALDKLKINN